MLRSLLKSKIHQATVTNTNIDYDGSLTLDPELMKRADIQEYEKVLVADIKNGNRFETYVIKGKNPGEVCVNGAAARLADIGDPIIIMSFVMLNQEEIKDHTPINVRLSSDNRPV
jgi:aspartate 1-decarboxylase